MKRIFANPLFLEAFRPLSRTGRSSMLSLLLLAAGFAALILGPMALGVCGCTMFSVSSAAIVLAAALGVGSTAFGALTIEREKKTLDSLRLTQLTAHEVLLGKLAPEAANLALILGGMAPAVAFSGLASGASLGTVFAVLLFAALAGVFAAVFGLFLSSLFATTSQAVVAGWISKAVWLLALPLLDVVAGAVLVQRVAPPVFSSLDPLAALGVLLVPEAAEGTRTWLPWLYPLVTTGCVAAMWIVASRRFATGMMSSSGLAGEKVHEVYRRGFGPAWLGRLFPTLHANPTFFRELAAQVRAGAGRWPGYMVFVVLFLAPTFYARSWSLKELSTRHLDANHGRVTVVRSEEARVSAPDDGLGCSNLRSSQNCPKGVLLSTPYSFDTQVLLEGHTDTACLRMSLFQNAGVPLPRQSLRFYRRAIVNGDNGGGPTLVPVSQPDYQTATAMQLATPTHSPRSLSQTSRRDITRSSLHVGIAGAIALLLLYLAIRFSAFLATAVTGERARRTWEDLALTGIDAGEAMKGKVLGAIILPAMQMTIVFPLLLLFVISGNLGTWDVAALYVYALSLSVAASMLGLWSSAVSPTSHDAHLRALGIVVLAFFLLPAALSALYVPMLCLVGLAFLMSAGREGFSSNTTAWGLVGLSLIVAPQALSPLTAAVSFMPSLTASHSFLSLLSAAPDTSGQAVVNLVGGVVMLLSLAHVMWIASLARLADPRQPEALRAEEAPRPEMAC